MLSFVQKQLQNIILQMWNCIAQFVYYEALMSIWVLALILCDLKKTGYLQDMDSLGINYSYLSLQLMITSDLIARYYSLSIWSLFEKLSFHDNKWQQRSLYHSRPSLNLTITNYITFFEKYKWLVWVGFLFTNDSNKFTGKETNRKNMDTKNWKQSFRLRCLPRFFPLWNKRIYQWIRRAFAMTTHSKQCIGFYLFLGSAVVPEIW